MRSVKSRKNFQVPILDDVKDARVKTLFEQLGTSLVQAFKNVFDDLTALQYVETDTALPTAAASLRGKLFNIDGGAGVQDKLYLCVKNAADAYVWKEIQFV